MINFIRKIIIYIMNINVLNFINDEIFLKIKYYIVTKNKLHLDNPKSFNEKLQWLKLYDRKSEYTDMVDKYKVKSYISKLIGEKYVIPTLGVYEKFDDINFKKLPNKFVIKCNHDSGGLVICKNKKTFDIKAARKKINWCLKRNYYYVHREWPYKNVKPLIIIEKFMETKDNDLTDYKFMCFNGKPEIIFTCTERFSGNGLKVTFFDPKWHKLPFERYYPQSKEKIPKPKNLNKMLELAKILSKDIPFVRVDFYEINNKIYFSELTFYPGSGYETFTPEVWDYKLGDMLELPQERTKNE